MICKYCDKVKGETKFVGDICFRHYQQIRKYGKVVRTVKDPNEIRISGNIAEMDLYDSKGQVTATTKFPANKVDLVSKFKWYYKNGYVRGNTDKPGQKQFLHRLLTRCPDDKVVDHIDRNGLNNLLSNLRVCSQGQNTRNRVYTRSKDVVGVKEVPSGNFQAIITINYKTVYLGTYATFDEAVAARQAAEKIHFGEFLPKGQ